MRGFFRMEGPVFEFLNRMADLIILNIMFLICCLPVVTIGPALCALSYSTLKISGKQEGYAWKNFLKAFRDNFRQGLVLGLIMLFFAAILYVDFSLIRLQADPFRQVMMFLVLLGTLVWLLVFVYLFPLQAKFANTITGTIRNALLLAVANLPRTMLLIGMIIAAVVITFWNGMTFIWGILAWMLIGFALLSYLNSIVIWPIFEKLIPPEEKEEEEEIQEETQEEIQEKKQEELQNNTEK